MKRIWVTEIKAICPLTGVIKTYAGPNIEAPTFELAVEFCINHKSYCLVVGELVSEIPCKPDSDEPDWDNQTDYDDIRSN